MSPFRQGRAFSVFYPCFFLFPVQLCLSLGVRLIRLHVPHFILSCSRSVIVRSEDGVTKSMFFGPFYLRRKVQTLDFKSAKKKKSGDANAD